MKNSYLERTPRSQKILFQRLETGLSAFGIGKFPLERRLEEERVLSLSRPKNKRQKGAEKCISFRRYFQGGYFIEVFPTFNEETGLFTTEGTASILVKRPSLKKGFKVCFQMYFFREEGMVERISTIASFLTKVLDNIPRDKKGRLMDLERTGDAKFSFVSENKRKEISITESQFLELCDKKSRKSILEIFENRKYYHENKNPKSESIRNIKKKRKVGTPKSVVPVFS